MAINKAPQGGFVIVCSLLFTMLLMLWPLPESLRFVRPEWVLMVLFYWAMALPNRVGVGYAWVVGLLMDVMMGGTLGVLAFAYALVIYLVLGFHLQLRQYPMWQQALSIMSLVLVVHIISVLISPRMASWHVWLPAVTSMIMWPFVYGTLRKLRRTFKVS